MSRKYIVNRDAAITRLEPSLKRELEQLAQRNERTVSAEIAVAVRAHVERESSAPKTENAAQTI